MCGRFTLTSTPEALAERFGLETAPVLAPRYNVAPGQEVCAIRADASGRRSAGLLHWGLVPGWASDPAVGNRMINARWETLAEKPAFRDALRKQRCLVPADGFYEWADRGGARQPFHIHRGDEALFGFAGLWDRWRDPEGEWLESCTIVTTQATGSIRELHHRMPVILPTPHYGAWLDPAQRDSDALLALLEPASSPPLVFHPVSTRVNRTGFDDPACLARVPELPRQQSLFE